MFSICMLLINNICFSLVTLPFSQPFKDLLEHLQALACSCKEKPWRIKALQLLYLLLLCNLYVINLFQKIVFIFENYIYISLRICKMSFSSHLNLMIFLIYCSYTYWFILLLSELFICNKLWIKP